MPTFLRPWNHPASSLADCKRAHHQYATLDIFCCRSSMTPTHRGMRPAVVDLDKLANHLDQLSQTEFEKLVTDGADDAKADRRLSARDPAAGDSRQSSAARSHRANVLIAISRSRKPCAYFLQERDMTRYDAVNYISPACQAARGVGGAAVRGVDEETETRQ